jgi:hypothetical protein
VLQKHLLQSAVLRFPAFDVVRRIQIEEPQRFHRAVHIKHIAVNDVLGHRAGLLDAVGIQLDAVSDNFLIPRDRLEGAARLRCKDPAPYNLRQERLGISESVPPPLMGEENSRTFPCQPGA